MYVNLTKADGDTLARDSTPTRCVARHLLFATRYHIPCTYSGARTLAREIVPKNLAQNERFSDSIVSP